MSTCDAVLLRNSVVIYHSTAVNTTMSLNLGEGPPHVENEQIGAAKAKLCRNPPYLGLWDVA